MRRSVSAVAVKLTAIHKPLGQDGCRIRTNDGRPHPASAPFTRTVAGSHRRGARHHAKPSLRMSTARRCCRATGCQLSAPCWGSRRTSSSVRPAGQFRRSRTSSPPPEGSINRPRYQAPPRTPPRWPRCAGAARPGRRSSPASDADRRAGAHARDDRQAPGPRAGVATAAWWAQS